MDLPNLLVLIAATVTVLPIATTVGVLVFRFSRGNYFARKCTKCGATDLSERKRKLVAWHADTTHNNSCRKELDPVDLYINTVENVTYHCNVCFYDERVTIRRICLQDGNFNPSLFSRCLTEQNLHSK